jgi:hypothetical protein
MVFSAQADAKADIIDLPDDGGKGYFLDESTGLVWQDVDNFLDMTCFEIEAQLAGTDWHFATLAELSPILDLVAGKTFSEWFSIMGGAEYLGEDRINGFFYPGAPGTASGQRLTESRYADYGWEIVGWGASNWNSYHHEVVGAFVVSNNPIPEPSTIWLLGAGLIGLAEFKRKTRRL